MVDNQLKQDVREIKQDLRKHIRRTNLLERKMETFDDFLKQVNTIVKLGIFIVGLSTVIGVALEIWRTFK